MFGNLKLYLLTSKAKTWKFPYVYFGMFLR
jgi:hypothetical protein